jgi:hypothetical protein
MSPLSFDVMNAQCVGAGAGGCSSGTTRLRAAIMGRGRSVVGKRP